MSVEIGQIYPYFFEKDKSRALFNAKVWIGDPDTDPEFNRKVVVGVQENGTEVALNQPLVTNSGGGFSYNGSPVLVRVDPPYSMKVMNSKGQQEYYWPNINPTGSAPTVGATITETQTLTDGQTVVDLANQLNGYINVRVNGDFIDDSVLVIDVDYTQLSSTSIELTDSYPDGTLITITQNDLSGDSKGPVYCFETLEAAEAANLSAGSCLSINELGGAKYVVQEVGASLKVGDFNTNNNLVARLQAAPDGSYIVTWFGADGYIASTTDQVAYFNLAAQRVVQEQNGTNKSPIIDIPGGTFRLNSAVTNSATWRLQPNAKIIGLDGVSPTFEDDTSYLTGTVIAYSGVDQQRTIRYGDPKFTVQKYTGKGYASEITTCSDNAAGGITAMTHSSATDTVNQACIAGTFVGLQNNSNVTKSTWAMYLEGVRDVGNEAAVFCMESTMFNRGPVVRSSPYGKYHLPQTGLPAWNLWLTSGGTQAGVQDCNAATGAIGIKANDGVPFDKGILFRDGAIATPAIAIATPDSYKWAWFSEDTSGDEVISARISGGLPTNGQFAIDVRNESTEALESWIATPFQLTFSINNQANLGSALLRIKTAYLQNSPDVVSDETKKTQKRELSQSEIEAGLEMARNIQMFKWISEVEEKDAHAAYFHTSVMAQKAWQILIDHDLDPTNYGFISNSDDGWSVMQSELSMLMCAAIVKNQDDITDRLTALEAK